ncbi:MAG: HAD-IC family P-type ATPase [Actinomycetota bacterium]|nr:HAD-IC family P-type ATPase [Actinomycetota bacterium]
MRSPDRVVAGTAGRPGIRGLGADEVRERTDAGLVNDVLTPTSRSFAAILRANVLTRFNAILGGLLVVVAVVGPPQDGLFAVVVLVNAGIGVVQEARAKAALDRLAVLDAPVAHALREGAVADVPIGSVVLDDVLELRRGDQAVADAVVLDSSGLQLDESLLTGESLPVDKSAGDEVLSGSVVVAGAGLVRVVRVGADAYAQRLERAATRFAVAPSEIQRVTDRVLRAVSWAIVPVGALLTASELLRAGVGWREALRGSVAGVAAMVPEGLVLLTTVAFAMGALRLARRRVLVQSLPAIEGLARVDVLCIDKTGTLTAADMVLDRVVALSGEIGAPLGALGAADPAPNATLAAIARRFPAPDGWDVVATVPFSSERTWSAAQFEGRGTWVLGAPEVVLGEEAARRLLGSLDVGVRGARALALARAEQSLTPALLPAGLVPAGVVLMRERLRPGAAETVAYLREQGVVVKVLSGDDPWTVADVARQVGLPVDGDPWDARRLPTEPGELAVVVEGTGVLGRVQPDQKRAIVGALQANGHVVAMTGDGVNDVPALKLADVGIAMGSGSQASRAVANIVLLDDSFGAVPRILGEGRRVIANIERVASLFVTKTVYALILAVVVGALALHLSVLPASAHGREHAHDRRPGVPPRARSRCTSCREELPPAHARVQRPRRGRRRPRDARRVRPRARARRRVDRVGALRRRRVALRHGARGPRRARPPAAVLAPRPRARDGRRGRARDLRSPRAPRVRPHAPVARPAPRRPRGRRAVRRGRPRPPPRRPPASGRVAAGGATPTRRRPVVEGAPRPPGRTVTSGRSCAQLTRPAGSATTIVPLPTRGDGGSRSARAGSPRSAPALLLAGRVGGGACARCSATSSGGGRQESASRSHGSSPCSGRAPRSRARPWP